MKVQEIRNYYDNLSSTYDSSRFGNTYGRFIDRQERRILNVFLKNTSGPTIDLACGTGRFMDYCTHGIDLSEAMINIAKSKFPDKSFDIGNVLDFRFEQTYKQAVCFHLIMHLDKEDLAVFLNKCYYLLEDDGLLLFDIPSAERKSALGTSQNGWHGSNAYSRKEIISLLGHQWCLKREIGILFIPIHRLPKKLRLLFVFLDGLINRTPLKRFASYRVYVIQKTIK